MMRKYLEAAIRALRQTKPKIMVYTKAAGSGKSERALQVSRDILKQQDKSRTAE